MTGNRETGTFVDRLDLEPALSKIETAKHDTVILKALYFKTNKDGHLGHDILSKKTGSHTRPVNHNYSEKFPSKKWELSGKV